MFLACGFPLCAHVCACACAHTCFGQVLCECILSALLVPAGIKRYVSCCCAIVVLLFRRPPVICIILGPEDWGVWCYRPRKFFILPFLAKFEFRGDPADLIRFVYRCRDTSTDGTMFFCAPESEVKRVFCSPGETLHGSYADDPRLTWRHLVTDGDRRRLEVSINQYV